MSTNQEKILGQLKGLIGELQFVQSSSKTVLRHISSDMFKTIKDAKTLLAKNPKVTAISPNHHSREDIEKWFDKVIAEIQKEEKTIVKGTYQMFNKALAKRASNPIITTPSTAAIKNYVFGLVCNEIATNNLIFSASANVTNYVKSLKDEVVEAVYNHAQNVILPPPIFLAEMLLFLYIDSSQDSNNPFEFDSSSFTAGYIYIKMASYWGSVKDGAEGYVHIRTDEEPPYIDDVSGDENVIALLHQYFNSSTPLVYLPIKIQVSIDFIVSEAVGSGNTRNLAFVGANLPGNVKFERQADSDVWTMITSLPKETTDALSEDLDVEAKILHIKLDQLIPE